MAVQNIFRAVSAFFEVSPCDCDKNAQSVIDMLSSLAVSRPDAVVFGKNAIEGNGLGCLYDSAPLRESSAIALERIVTFSNAASPIIFLGHTIGINGCTYNVTSVVFRGKIHGMSCEVQPPVSEIEFLGQAIPIAKNISIVINDGVKIAVVSGDDVLKLYPDMIDNARSAQLLVMPMSLDARGFAKDNLELLHCAAAAAGCGIAVCSNGFGESSSGILKNGVAAFACPSGRCIYKKQQCNTKSYIFDFDIDIINHQKRAQGLTVCTADALRLDFKLSKKSEIIGDILSCPFALDSKSLDEIFERCANGLAARLTGAGFTKAVLGVSGGIDSTLVLFVLVEAFRLAGLDKSGIMTVTLPGPGSSVQTKKNTAALLAALEIDYREIDITDTIVKHLFDIGHDTVTQDIVYENAQARERTQVLLDLANMQNALMVGTGDLSEQILGFCTFGGDNISGFNPISFVTKTEAKLLLSHIVKRQGWLSAAVSVAQILDTPISPELRHDEERHSVTQKTEDIVGRYEVLDFYIYYFLRFGLSPQKLLAYALNAFEGRYDAQYLISCLKNLFSRFIRNRFKSRCSGEGSPGYSFTMPLIELGIPSDMKYNVYTRDLEELSDESKGLK